MRRKFLSILLGITLAGTLLCACSGASLEDAASVMKEDLEKDAKWAREHNAGGDEYDQEVADQLIDSVENISEKRKEFYKTILKQRYEKILLKSYHELKSK